MKFRVGEKLSVEEIRERIEGAEIDTDFDFVEIYEDEKLKLKKITINNLYYKNISTDIIINDKKMSILISECNLDDELYLKPLFEMYNVTSLNNETEVKELLQNKLKEIVVKTIYNIIKNGIGEDGILYYMNKNEFVDFSNKIKKTILIKTNTKHNVILQEELLTSVKGATIIDILYHGNILPEGHFVTVLEIITDKGILKFNSTDTCCGKTILEDGLEELQQMIGEEILDIRVATNRYIEDVDEWSVYTFYNIDTFNNSTSLRFFEGSNYAHYMEVTFESIKIN